MIEEGQSIMGSTRYGNADCDKCEHRVFGADYTANDNMPCSLKHQTRVRFADDAGNNPYADNRITPVATKCEDWSRTAKD